ncbi:MAG: hypothetical protein NW200_03325 [Hyphomonadaceae bacterium]|nr:hypothetical protein [Hyphomonadaceae bacterium]
MTDTPPSSVRPALSSLTLRGAASMAIAFGLSKLGVTLPDGAPQAIADALAELVFYAGLIAVGVGRARARGPLI